MKYSGYSFVRRWPTQVEHWASVTCKSKVTVCSALPISLIIVGDGNRNPLPLPISAALYTYSYIGALAANETVSTTQVSGLTLTIASQASTQYVSFSSSLIRQSLTSLEGLQGGWQRRSRGGKMGGSKPQAQVEPTSKLHTCSAAPSLISDALFALQLGTPSTTGSSSSASVSKLAIGLGDGLGVTVLLAVIIIVVIVVVKKRHSGSNVAPSAVAEGAEESAGNGLLREDQQVCKSCQEVG